MTIGLWRTVAERLHDPELCYVPVDLHTRIRITASIKGLSDHCVVDREVAGSDVNLSDRLIVDLHLQTLVLRMLLITLTDTVQTTSSLPRSVVEDALVAVVSSACELEGR